MKAKPDPLKQQITNLTPPPQYSIPPRDPEIYLSTSPWQIMDYDFELKLKTQIIASLFGAKTSAGEFPEELSQTLKAWPDAENLPGKIPQETPSISPIITDSREYFYRNKMEYALYWDNAEQNIKLAFHQRNSHRKIPFAQSSIERPEILTKAKEIIADLNARHEQARTYQSLLLRCDQQGTVSGGLLRNGHPHPVFPPLTDTLMGRQYTYSPNGFFQINLPVYELALRAMAPHITTDKVLDLYSGVGTIGLSIARDRQLTLVETNASAHAELVKNSADLNSATPILAKSEEATSYITPDTTVIVDPPRAGLHRTLVSALNEIKPPTIIYLSCNPTTQARDIKLLSENYRLSHLQPFNFFPRTPHIENLTILTLR